MRIALRAFLFVPFLCAFFAFGGIAYAQNNPREADLQCPKENVLQKYATKVKPPAYKDEAGKTIINLSWKTCRDLEGGKAAASGYCVSAGVCSANKCAGEACKKPDVAVKDPGTTAQTPPQQPVGSPTPQAPSGSLFNQALDEALKDGSIGGTNPPATTPNNDYLRYLEPQEEEQLDAVRERMRNEGAPPEGIEARLRQFVEDTHTVDPQTGQPKTSWESLQTLQPYHLNENGDLVDETGKVVELPREMSQQSTFQSPAETASTESCGWWWPCAAEKVAAAWDSINWNSLNPFDMAAQAGPRDPRVGQALAEAVHMACQSVGCDENMIAQALGGTCNQESQCDPNNVTGSYRGVGQLSKEQMRLATQTLQKLANSGYLSSEERAIVQGVVDDIRATYARGGDPAKDPRLGTYLFVARQMEMPDLGPTVKPLQQVSAATDDVTTAAYMFQVGQIAPNTYLFGQMENWDKPLARSAIKALGSNSVFPSRINLPYGSSLNDVMDAMDRSRIYSYNIPRGIEWASQFTGEPTQVASIVDTSPGVAVTNVADLGQTTPSPVGDTGTYERLAAYDEQNRTTEIEAQVSRGFVASYAGVSLPEAPAMAEIPPASIVAKLIYPLETPPAPVRVASLVGEGSQIDGYSGASSEEYIPAAAAAPPPPFVAPAAEPWWNFDADPDLADTIARAPQAVPESGISGLDAALALPDALATPPATPAFVAEASQQPDLPTAEWWDDTDPYRLAEEAKVANEQPSTPVSSQSEPAPLTLFTPPVTPPAPYSSEETKDLINKFGLTHVDPKIAESILPPRPAPYPETLPPQTDPLLQKPISGLTDSEKIAIIRNTERAVQDYWEKVWRANGGEYRRADVVIIDSVDYSNLEEGENPDHGFSGRNGKVYIDLDNIRQTPSTDADAKGIVIAQTVAHEVGHYVARVTYSDLEAITQVIFNGKNPPLTAITGYSRGALEELQADYVAGASLRGSGLLGAGDPERLYYYTASTGDDVRREGSPTDQPFSHGTGADRAQVFYEGLTTGNLEKGLAMLGTNPDWKFANASTPWKEITYKPSSPDTISVSASPTGVVSGSIPGPLITAEASSPTFFPQENLLTSKNGDWTPGLGDTSASFAAPATPAGALAVEVQRPDVLANNWASYDPDLDFLAGIGAAKSSESPVSPDVQDEKLSKIPPADSTLYGEDVAKDPVEKQQSPTTPPTKIASNTNTKGPTGGPSDGGGGGGGSGGGGKSDTGAGKGNGSSGSSNPLSALGSLLGTLLKGLTTPPTPPQTQPPQTQPSPQSPVTVNAPTATLSCAPEVADVGMSIAITYGCSSGVASSSSFTITTQPSGSATTTVKAPPGTANTATYTLGCTENGRTSGAQCSVQVNKPNIILVANPKTVVTASSSLISWLTTGMDSCIISSPDIPGFTAQNSSNTSVSGAVETPSLSSDAIFQLDCTTLGGANKRATTTVRVQ